MPNPLFPANHIPKIRLVVAEDSQGTRHNLINLLGFEPDIEVVGAVGWAQQALDLVAHLRPRLVLMDINLPDMDGLEATRRIRTSFPEINVIVMSVHDEESYYRRAREAGAVAYLVKPFSGDELVNVIRRYAIVYS